MIPYRKGKEEGETMHVALFAGSNTHTSCTYIHIVRRGILMQIEGEIDYR